MVSSTKGERRLAAIMIADNSGGRIHLGGDIDCFYFSYEKVCAAIFGNPSGTREQRNEYYWLLPWNLIAFSVEQ